MSVILVFGCAIPLSICNNRRDYSNVYNIIQKIFGHMDIDTIHEEYCDLSGRINVPNTSYNIQIYTHGEVASAFIQLKSIRCSIQNVHIHIEDPTDTEVAKFRKFLRKYGIKYEYSMHLLIQS